jgi:hypothetical protein
MPVNTILFSQARDVNLLCRVVEGSQFPSLPLEIRAHILFFLDDQSLYRISQVNSECYAFSNKEFEE